MLTITFLTLMAMLTSSQMQHTVNEGIKGAAYSSYLALNQEAAKETARAAFEDLRDKKAESSAEPQQFKLEKKSYKGKSAPLNYDHARPPNNSRLNLYLLMSDDHPKAHPLYETTAALLRSLYGGHTFFQEVPRAEYALLNTLIDHQEEAKSFFFADELGSLRFKEPKVQHLFYRMLKGSFDYPSLLHFITYDKNCNTNQKKVNFMFAPEEVLTALISDPICAEKLLAFRQALWQQIDEQEANRAQLSKEQVKNRTHFKNLLTDYFKEVANTELSALFDFSLGKKGQIIFVEDPTTGIVSREKIMKKRL